MSRWEASDWLFFSAIVCQLLVAAANGAALIWVWTR